MKTVPLRPMMGLFAIVLSMGAPQVNAELGSAKLPRQERPFAPEFKPGMQWFNVSKPVTMKDLRGKIVLLDFWTYCCINCMHIIPDLKKLEAKYPNELVVIGVHSGKFENEKLSKNIREAIKRYEIEHPVVNDLTMDVWRTWKVESWPTLFLVDPDGRVYGFKAGEGVFDPFDRAIESLVKEFTANGKLDRKPFAASLERARDPKTSLSYPGKITSDADGKTLFVSDSNNNRILVMSPDGAVNTIIGGTSSGLVDGDFKTARFFRPQGVCFDSESGFLYVADTENHAVRRIDLKNQKVTTIVGTGKQASQYPPVSGIGKSAALSSPWDLTLVKGTLYVAMAGTHQLWTINLATLKATPYAGTGGENIVDGILAKAQLAQPSGITTDGKRLYFADSEVSAVRYADIAFSEVGTLIGKGLFEFGDVDGKGPAARLQHPIGVTYNDGYLYVADTYNHKVRKLDPKTRELTTFIGTGKPGRDDGPAKSATLYEPTGLSWVAGKLYITDTNNHLIRVFDPAGGTLTTLKVTGL